MAAESLTTRLREHLSRIYGHDRAAATLPRLVALVDRFRSTHPELSTRRRELFDETDIVLICYGDQVREPGRPPLETLARFLQDHVGDVISGLHLLPHHPSTSDDGFAVADYTAVDPALGEWRHVRDLASSYSLMLDAVVNHTSAAHPWFARWKGRDPRYSDYYLATDPSADLSSVTRPRTSPLLTPVATDDGDSRSVWTTFSADQVDLNYANPDVLVTMTEVLLGYAGHGARRLRLDAVAFLWKQRGTTCMHLPQTHEIIRLWRTILDDVAPGTLLVTETNVPHEENVSYFGTGTDEAHLVYQFALPPLALAAFHSRDAGDLREWARALQTPTEQTTYLNFLASHDGIGLRPVEGLLPPEEVDRLCSSVERQGGRVSYRAHAGGKRPYELNSVYFDALSLPGEPDPVPVQVDRFLAAHSILLALAGVPAVYFHSLFGSRNWVEGAVRTGSARVINRQRLARAALETEIAQPSSLRRQVRDRMLARIQARTAEAAFHPNAAMACVESSPGHFAVQRTPSRSDTTVVCVHDVSGRPGRFRARMPDRLPGDVRLVDLCDGTEHTTEADGTVDVDLPPYGVRWLRAR